MASSPQRVAIIGAGPCGLAAAAAFKAAQAKGAAIPEIVVFEKQDDWGGLWNYTWRTGLDKYGEPVHGSMYSCLWSNGPRECLEMADYSFDEHFGKPIPSFPPRAVLADYILGRAKKSGVRDWIKFATVVRDVTFDAASAQFTVVIEDLPTHTRSSQTFTQVIVASGHFSVPNVPDFPGIGKFPGRVLHSHDFRNAQEFKGKNVLVVGSSYSAEDIALQCFKYGSAHVTMTYRTTAMGFDWPEGMDERPLVQGFDGAVASFADGSTKEFDAVILCTGYQHSFPFLDDALKLRCSNRLYPPGLFKGVVSEACSQLYFIGMQDQFYTFTMFDLQAYTVRDFILGRLALPSTAEQAAHSAKWVADEEAADDCTKQIDFQTAYCKELAADTDYPRFDMDMVAEEFKAWEHDKEVNILTYRNQAFKSPVTGTMASVHHTSWLEAMDDSLEGFVAAKL